MASALTHDKTFLRALRKDRLTDEERLEALWNREKPDRVPIWPLPLGFSTLNVGCSINDFYTEPKKSADARRWTCEQYGWQPTILCLGALTAFPAEEFGGEIEWPTAERAQAPSVALTLVETEEDVFSLKVPEDLEQVGTIPMTLEATAHALKGKTVSGGYIFSCGCELPPKAPPYNVWAMTKAVNDFGWYE